MKNTFLKIIISVATLLSVVSCRDWLEVKPTDRVLGSTLFSTSDGYMSAVNGIYMELISDATFNGPLTFFKADILAQYYYMGYPYTPSDYFPLSKFDDAERQILSDGVWNNLYIVIGNINNLLYQLENGLSDGVLTQEVYDMYKGEMLAMRAYLHFELYKLYGPIKDETPDMLTIPYADSNKLELKSLLKASELVDKIYEDLEAAETLLAGSDPIIKNGPSAFEEEGVSNDFRFRPFRMNYYAVKAVIARVALFVGDNDKAEQYALEVIKETQIDNNYFPFTERTLVTSNSGKDLVFSSEVLFALYNTKRTDDIYTPYFSESDDLSLKLVVVEEGYETLFPLSGDVRANQFSSSSDNETYFLMKYDATQPTNSSNPLNYNVYMPLIRISEMYMIVAEANADDYDTAYEYINTLREARNAVDIAHSPSSVILDDLRLEIAREFIGEGQLLWFYKRNAYTTIPIISPQYPSNSYRNRTITKDKYLFNIPISEDIER